VRADLRKRKSRATAFFLYGFCSTVGIGPAAPHVSLARSTWEDFYNAIGIGGQSQGEREQAYLTCSVCRGSHAQNSQPRHAVTPLYLQPIDTQPNGEACLLVFRV
jgi:hypothetical protein